MLHDDIHIHECIDETSLSNLTFSYLMGSLFGLDFGGGSSFTSWIKEHVTSPPLQEDVTYEVATII